MIIYIINQIFYFARIGNSQRESLKVKNKWDLSTKDDVVDLIGSCLWLKFKPSP